MPDIILTDRDLARIAQLSGHDLARLYQFLTDRLRAAKVLETPNANVVTIRLPPRALDHVNGLALRHGTNRSHIVREAVLEFLRRNPI